MWKRRSTRPLPKQLLNRLPLRLYKQRNQQAQGVTRLIPMSALHLIRPTWIVETL